MFPITVYMLQVTNMETVRNLRLDVTNLT